MAELYEKPKLYANAPAGVTPISGDPDLDKVLAELPPEEREEAMRKITAPPTGEEIARAMMEKNSNGEMFNMSLEQYRLLKAHNKNKEVDIISTFGQAAGGIYDELMKAAESVTNNPADALAKVTPSLIEAFAQGTRNLYGMAAQSADPTSVMFRMKNALSANGSDEEAEYRQFMEAQQFNIHSMNLMSGKETLIMDKDVINPEMTQVMSYVADPTLFVPFGGIAAKGARIIGMGEGLAKASARASAIRNKVLGGTLKWGVGAPIEFLGNATRNTIDYGLERSATAFEFATGMPAAEAQATARMYGLNSVAGSLAGQTVPLPIVGNVAGAMVGATTAQGVGEAIGMLGEQMIKQQKHGRGVLSYAGQALRDSEKAGVQLSAHAKGLLRVIDMADPLFVYGADIAEGAGTGMVIGGGLGYLAGGEEGMASGAGAGFALGAVGAGLGSVTADVTNNRLYDRIAIQRKMVIEGLKGTDDAKASALEAYVASAESTGDRRYMAEVDGMIAGIDLMSPNSKWNIRTEAEHTAWLKSLNIDPKTGRLVETTAILPQFGSNRKQRASALSFLSMVSDNFSGLPENLLQHIDTLPADHAMRKHWARLSDDVKQAVLAEVKQSGDIEYRKKFGNKKSNQYYGDINYAEAHTARINALFDSGNPTQATERINMLLKEETVGGKLTERGKALKDKLATEGYFDKDGNMRPSRLKDVEATDAVFQSAAGFVLRRDSTGQVEVNLNLNKIGKVTGLHELFHAIMLDSPMKDEFIDRLSTKLLGKFDANGKRIEGASVDTNQVKKFFQRYIDSLHRNNAQERANETKRLERAIEEYEQRGDQNKVNRTTSTTLEELVEEFGAYYFPKFIQDKPVDYLFRGGELGAMREMLQSVKFGWLDFWRSKIGSANPDLNFDAIQGYNISQAFGKDGQPRYKNKALDLFMGDFVKATAMANRNGNFDLSRLSPEGQKTFIKNNGIRGYGTIDKDGKLVRLNRRTALREEMRVGKEIYKIVAGLDPKLRQGLTLDGEGNFSGRVSPELADALVASGHVDRAWVDKLLRAYDVIDGKESNVIEFGYLGRTAQIGDYAWPRLVGSDVPFKNRTAILLDVDFKIGKDGRMTALYHTLDHAVIEGRANAIWSDPAIRSLWDGSRTAMEADFFRYLSNASLPSEHPSRVPSAKLLEDGTGKGAMRRNALHQMLGMAKLDGDAYLNKPIAEIPLGIRHSVTTFNIDGVSGLRVRQGARYDYNHRNAFRDLSRNFMPSELTSEKTANGEVLKHASGYKFIKTPNGKVNAYINSGKKIGTFDSIEKATQVAGAVYQKFYDTVAETGRKIESQQVANQRKFMIAEEQTRLNSNGRQGIFGTEQVSDFTKGTKIVKQTQQEFLTQRVLELLRPENKERLDLLIEQGWSKYREIYEIEQILNKEMEQLSLDMDELNRREKEYIDVIVHSLGLKGTPDEALGVAYGNIYQKKKAVNDRLIQIAKDLDSKGINERSYYAAKFAYDSIKNGERNIPLIEEFIGNIHKDLFNQNFNTGEPVSFVAVHGTPNKELLYTKTYDASRLGENTGSASARKATFFAGSDTTAITYVGNPLEKNWIFSEDWAYPSDTSRIRRSIERHYDKGVEVADSVIPMIENALDRIAEFDTTRGVVNELDRILSEKAVTNPDDFEAHPSARVLAKSSVGMAFREWILDYQTRMRDADVSFGSRDIYWKDAGRTPHILRNIVRMDNPFVYEYTRDTFRDVSFNDAITQAQQAGHDGVIFKNIRDGGGTDIIYALIAEDPNQKVMVIDTSADKDAVSRGYDENGEKILNGRELNLQMMPTEDDMYRGGRIYNQNSKKWKSGFIGLWAEENPDRLKGYNIEFFQKEAGAYRIRLQDNSVKGRTVDVGHITAVVSGDTATISSKIADEYQGNKLSYALYSEMAERLRAMGIRRVDGQIVNRDGVPIRVRERIIGDTRDYFSGKPIDQIEGAIRIREKQAQFGNMAGVDVYNRLDPNARYMPSEDIGSPQNVTEVHEWLNEVRNKGGDYTAVPMSESIKQTFGNLEAFKKARKEDMLTALEKAMRYGSQQAKDLLESVKSGKTPIKDAVDWIKKNGDFYTYNAELKDIRDERANLAKAVLRAMGEMRKISDKDGRRYNTEGEREHRNTMRQMPEEGGRTYTKKQMDNEFIGRQAAERRDLTNGIRLAYRGWDKQDGKDEGRKLIILTRTADGNEIGRIDFDYEHLTKYGMKGRGFGDGDKDGIIVDGINVKVWEAFQGKGYQHILYSEMFERARAIGATGFSQSIENKKGLPLKSVNRVIGEADNFIASLSEPEPQKPTQENFDRLMAGAPSPTGNWMSNAPAVQNWGKIDKKAWYQPAEGNIPTRDQGFNRVYREISRNKKAATRKIKQAYLDKWGIDLGDYEKFQQLTDAHYKLEQELADGKHKGDEMYIQGELRDIKEQIKDLDTWMTDKITETQGDYAYQFSDQLDELERGISRIDTIINQISKQPLRNVDLFNGNNRLEKILGRELSSGFKQGITGMDIPIADSFREYAGMKFEDTLGKAFESELYSSQDYYSENKKGLLIDILRSENKLTQNGLPQGEVNPRRIINALRNKSGGDSKVYAEAKAIGLIDWLESKQEGRNQKKVTTKELIEFVEENKMGLAIDPQLEQNADFGNTRPYVTGGEEQAKKGYRVYVVRMANPKHEHGVAGHFEGAVVHVRVTLRTTKEGKKVMHIEEIQANNTASDILSPKQKELVAKEINILEEFQKQKDILIQERVDDQAAVDTDKTLHTLERSQLKAEIRERERKQRQQLIDKTANELFNSNPEFYKEQYNFNSQKTDDAYIDMLKGQISSRDTNLIISERKTALNKVKNNAPLQDPKEWVKVAFRTVLRKALVEGVDRITLTPWDETPVQVGLKPKSAERFYGGTIVDSFNSELAKMNSVLSSEGKHESIPREKYSKSKQDTNDAVQKVATNFDAQYAQNKGADVKTIFKLLHTDDADLASNHTHKALETRMEFLLKGVPEDTNGKHELTLALQRRLNQFSNYMVLNESLKGGNHPSGLQKKASAAHMSNSEYLVDRSMGFDLTPEIRKQASKPQRLMQPAEGWRDWQSERTSVGSVIKNTAGYVIMVQKGKFKVYNPYKAIVGIYDSEEQAKRRVQKDEPRG